MRRLEYFIVSDNLQPILNDEGSILIEGRIWCQHDLYVSVRKTLELNENGQVRTISYSYHCGIDRHPPRSIFRYDNAHRYIREKHPDEHHRHRYDESTWEQISPPDWIGYERWPHLSDVIEELYEWWQERGRFIFGKS